MNRITKLIQLSAKTDQLINFGWGDMVKSAWKGLPGKTWAGSIGRGAGAGALQGGAVGAGLGAAGYAGLHAAAPAMSRAGGLQGQALNSFNQQIRARGYKGMLGDAGAYNTPVFSARHANLLELSSKADDLINFAYNDEEENEGHLLRNTAIAGAAGAGGLYAAGRGAIGPVQPGLAGIGQTISQGASRVGGAVSSAAGGMKDTFMKGYGKGGIMRGVRGLARSLTRGKSAMVGLSSRSALVQLNTKLDSVICFDDQALMDRRKKSQIAALKYSLRNRVDDAGERGALGGKINGAALGAYLGHTHGLPGGRGALFGAALGVPIGSMAGRLLAARHEIRKMKDMAAEMQPK